MFRLILNITNVLLFCVIFAYAYNFIGKKYKPSRKWFVSLARNVIVEIIPKYEHLEDQMDALVLAPKFIKWLNNFDSEQIMLRAVTVTDIDWFSATPNPQKLGFVKCSSEAYDYETGKKIMSNISFVRGDSVAILILVKVLHKQEKNDKEYVLLCEQQRLPIGQKAREIAAGMMDADGNIVSVVLKEVKEETGFDIKHADELQALGSYFASPGGTDEKINLFAWTTAISEDEFNENRRRMYGLTEENEEIKLSFVELESFKTVVMYKIGDAKAEIALSRFLAKNVPK